MEIPLSIPLRVFQVPLHTIEYWSGWRFFPLLKNHHNNSNNHNNNHHSHSHQQQQHHYQSNMNSLTINDKLHINDINKADSKEDNHNANNKRVEYSMSMNEQQLYTPYYADLCANNERCIKPFRAYTYHPHTTKHHYHHTNSNNNHRHSTKQ